MKQKNLQRNRVFQVVLSLVLICIICVACVVGPGSPNVKKDDIQVNAESIKIKKQINAYKIAPKDLVSALESAKTPEEAERLQVSADISIVNGVVDLDVSFRIEEKDILLKREGPLHNDSGFNRKGFTYPIDLEYWRDYQFRLKDGEPYILYAELSDGSSMFTLNLDPNGSDGVLNLYVALGRDSVIYIPITMAKTLLNHDCVIAQLKDPASILGYECTWFIPYATPNSVRVY